jgi:hypothetical protein
VRAVERQIAREGALCVFHAAVRYRRMLLRMKVTFLCCFPQGPLTTAAASKIVKLVQGPQPIERDGHATGSAAKAHCAQNSLEKRSRTIVSEVLACQALNLRS